MKVLILSLTAVSIIMLFGLVDYSNAHSNGKGSYGDPHWHDFGEHKVKHTIDCESQQWIFEGIVNRSVSSYTMIFITSHGNILYYEPMNFINSTYFRNTIDISGKEWLLGSKSYKGKILDDNYEFNFAVASNDTYPASFGSNIYFIKCPTLYDLRNSYKLLEDYKQQYNNLNSQYQELLNQPQNQHQIIETRTPNGTHANGTIHYDYNYTTKTGYELANEQIDKLETKKDNLKDKKDQWKEKFKQCKDDRKELESRYQLLETNHNTTLTELSESQNNLYRELEIDTRQELYKQELEFTVSYLEACMKGNMTDSKIMLDDGNYEVDLERYTDLCRTTTNLYELQDRYDYLERMFWRQNTTSSEQLQTIFEQQLTIEKLTQELNEAKKKIEELESP